MTEPHTHGGTDAPECTTCTTAPKHPDLVRIERRIAESIEQGYQHGDVNHYVQPIIGIFRMRQHMGQPITDEDINEAIERLTKACNAENALLAYLHPEKYGL